MNLQMALDHRSQVEEFRRKHRTGLVTLLFTDIVGSTQIKQALGDRQGVALIQQHHALVREILRQFKEGAEISTAGDSFFIVFVKPSDAVWFSLLVQARLRALAGQIAHGLHDRIGIHIGEVVIEEREGMARPKDLYGAQVDICARVMSLAGADQILLTRSAFDNARQVLKGEELKGLNELQWLNHGPYAVKGWEEPVEICEVGESGAAVLKAPGDSEKAHRLVSGEQELVLGWRPALEQAVPGTKWVLENKLGEGGFGEVWVGRHQTIKEQRVFKFCFRADRVRTLKREVTLFRVLKERVGEHPNIVRLLEVYFDEPPYYIEMDYVEGRDLKTWSEERGGVERIPMEVRLEIVAQVADALQAAHEAGVIHRDVKPGNILIAECGVRSAQSANHKSEFINHKLVAKLTDFGIGQVMGEEYLAGITRAGFTQTMLGSTSSSGAGTQMYLAPEIVAGKPASTRSDIYSLGVVLYQLLVGDFSRPVATDWADGISDPLLRDDLKHCFAGNPAERFAGAGQLAENLRALPHRQKALAEQQAAIAAKEKAAYRRGVFRTASLSAGILAIVVALTVLVLNQSARAKRAAKVAEEKSQQAIEERKRAEIGEAEARRLTYIANMNLLQDSWEKNNTRRVVQLLKETGEFSDRGFEWYFWQGQLRSAFRTLRYPVRLTSAAFSPDSQRIVAGGRPGLVKVWDVSSGRELFDLRGHTSSVWFVAFSPNGQRISTGSQDKTAKLWDASNGRELFTLKGHTDYVTSADFSADGRRIVTASGDHTAKVWEADGGKELLTLKGHIAAIWDAAFSPDGLRIATASSDQTAIVWDAASGRELLTLAGHTGIVDSLAWSPDGAQIVTASTDHTVKVFETTTGRELFTLRGHTDWARSVAWSPDGKRILTGSLDATAREWDAATGLELRTIQGHTGAIWYVDYSRDGRWICTASDDGTVKVWVASQERDQRVLKGHPTGIRSLCFVGGGQWIVTASDDGIARVWEITKGRELFVLKGHEAMIWSVAVSADGTRIATGSEDQTARIWDASTGRELLVLKGMLTPIWCVAFAPGGQNLMVGGADNEARLLDITSGRELLALKGHAAGIKAAAFSSSGGHIATGSADGTIKIWESPTGRELFTLRGHLGSVDSIAFSNDGKWVVSGSADSSARVWETATGRELLSLKGHAAPIRSVAFSRDGRRIVTASDDRSVKVWETSSGRDLLTLKWPSSPVWSVSMSPGDQRIVTGNMDGTAVVWEAASPEQTIAWRKESEESAQSIGEIRVEQARAQPAQQSIKQWLLLAPIPFEAGQSSTEALNQEQIPGENQLRPRLGEKVSIGNQQLAWRAVRMEAYIYLDFNFQLGRPVERSVGYAVSYVWADTERQGLRVLVGSDDQSVVYLNGKRIYQTPGPRSRVVDVDAVEEVDLRAGLNVLVFKVVNEALNWRGSIRFTDANGNPVQGIKVMLSPE